MPHFPQGAEIGHAAAASRMPRAAAPPPGDLVGPSGERGRFDQSHAGIDARIAGQGETGLE